MSTVNGFQVGSETLKYNYESLDNYNTPNFSTSSSTTYAVGDYVMYNGKLYKCTTATTGGTWVSGSWAEAVLSDDVGDLTRQLNASDVLPLSAYPLQNGYAMATGLWGYTTGTYKVAFFPVASGDVVTLVGNASRGMSWGVLTTIPTVVNGQTVPYSTDANFTGRKELNTSVTKPEGYTYMMPADAACLMLSLVMNNNDAAPTKLIVNGFDYVATIRQGIADNSSSIAGIQSDVSAFNLLPLLNRELINGNISGANFKWNNINDNYRFSIIEVNPGDRLVFQTGNAALALAVLNTYSAPDTNVVADLSEDENWNRLKTFAANGAEQDYILPSDAHYLLVWRVYGGTTFNLIKLEINNISYIESTAVNALRLAINKAENLGSLDRWIALGDSLTEGYYSNDTTTGYALNPKVGWVYKLANSKAFKCTNLGIGGTGYLRDHSGENDAGWQIADNTDFSTADFVTVAFGVNDWKYNMPLGSFDDAYSTPTSIYGAMRHLIERITTSNPLCKIFVISPINSSAYGTKETNWGIGYQFSNNGTLEQVCAAIKTVCDYYGIQYIDMLHDSIVNRENIQSCLLDGVHPTPETHTVMMHEIAGRMMFT